MTFPKREDKGCVKALLVHGILTLFYFEEDNPTHEKQEAVRRSKEALEDAQSYAHAGRQARFRRQNKYV